MSSTDNLNKSATQLIGEINTLLDQINTQNGGNPSVISEINTLLSDSNITQQGGKRRKKRSSKSKKSGSKKSGSKKSRSKKSRSKKSKSKKSRTKSKSRKMRRTNEQESGEKKKRTPNKAFMDMVNLKKWIKEKLSSEDLNFITLSKPVSALYKANDKNLEKAKKNFDKTSFMKDYREAEKNRKTRSKKN